MTRCLFLFATMASGENLARIRWQECYLNFFASKVWMAQLLSVRQYQRGPSHHKTRRKERQFRRRQDRLL